MSRVASSIRAHRPVFWFMLAGLAAVTVIGVVGVNIVRRISTDQAIANARDLTEADARSLQENLTDGVLAGDPEARLALDRAIRTRLLSHHVVRVKVWDATGRIVASDEGSLVGRRFVLADDERRILGTGEVSAESSDLGRPENAHERRFGHLLEVYAGTRTPTGTPLLFESYIRYETITANGNRMLVAFAPALVGGLLLLWIVQLPLALALERRLRRSRDRERALLIRAIESSDRERRRIAADLHDSVVQDLAGSSMSLAALARVVHERGDNRLAGDLDARAADLRQRVRDLRTLVVAIAPRRLHDEGLAAALEDLASTVRARGIETSVAVANPLALDRAGEALLFRGAQEAVRNTIDHTSASRVDIAVGGTEHDRVRLRVHDDGAGFDPALPRPGDGGSHLGLALLADLAVDAGGGLRGPERARRRHHGGPRGTRPMTAPVIRVLVVDDHPVVRRGISDLLGSVADVEVIGTAGDGASGVNLAGTLDPDVVLMDIEMPGVDGVEATHRIGATAPRAAVVILTTFADRARITRALDAGAAGYLLKDAEPSEIIDGIRAAAAGSTPISPRAADRLADDGVDAIPAALTPREREVLTLLADGLANKQIARRLGIAEKTVKAHLTRVFAALDVTDRTQAALWVARHAT